MAGPSSDILIHLIDAACDDNAARPCLMFGDRTLSFAEVKEASCQIASGLVALGVSPGMRGAVLAPNDPRAFVVTLGIIRAGAIWFPINPRNSLDDNLALLGQVRCDFLAYHSSYAGAAARIKATLPALRGVICLDASDGPDPALHDWMAAQAPRDPGVPVGPTDIVSIPMTGGTTGLPKPVALSNRNFAAMLRGVAGLGGGPHPVNLAAAPMTHVGGRIVLTAMYRGGTSVILPGAEPQAILDAIPRYGVTEVFLPPTMIYALLEHPRVRDTDLRSLRRISYGAAPMSIEKLKQAIAVFGPVMAGGYGQTEAPMLISHLTPEEHFVGGALAPDERLRSVGRATAASQIAIMGKGGALLPAGEVGEIVVRGAFVSEGYFEDPGATAAMRSGGWHLTGDVGHLDEEGYLYIVDRKKDMIITGGFNVYSAEIERVISALPGVRDCLVIGVPDEKWGETIKALVVLRPGQAATERDLIEFCRSRMAHFKCPTSVELRDALSRTATGKLQKFKLREPYWAGRDRRVS